MTQEEYYDRMVISLQNVANHIERGLNGVADSVIRGHKYTITGADDFAMLSLLITALVGVSVFLLGLMYRQVVEGQGFLRNEIVTLKAEVIDAVRDRCDSCRPSILMENGELPQRRTSDRK
jgi:hypothetical protein